MDYNIEQSSSSDIINIKWTQKNPSEPKKQKKKRNKISPTNTIPAKESKNVGSSYKPYVFTKKIYIYKDRLLYLNRETSNIYMEYDYIPQ